MIKKINKNDSRLKRHTRIRKKLTGTSLKPRLSVYRSLNHIYVQAIDDVNGITLVSASSVDKSFAGEKTGNPKQKGRGGNIDSAKKIGELIAVKLKEKNIDTVVFDRGGYLYHGRVAALAESARSNGLIF